MIFEPRKHRIPTVSQLRHSDHRPAPTASGLPPGPVLRKGPLYTPCLSTPSHAMLFHPLFEVLGPGLRRPCGLTAPPIASNRLPPAGAELPKLTKGRAALGCGWGIPEGFRTSQRTEARLCLPHTYWLRSREKAGAACPQRGLSCPGSSVLQAPSCHSQCGAGQLASQGRAGQGRAAKTNRTRQVSEQAEQDPSPSPWHCRAGQGGASGCCGHWTTSHAVVSARDASQPRAPGKCTDLGSWLPEEPSHSPYKGPFSQGRGSRGRGYKVKSPAVKELHTLPASPELN